MFGIEKKDPRSQVLRSKKLAHCLAALVIMMNLSGCAFKSIIYNRLDFVVMWQLDSYLDTTKEQEMKFRPVVVDAIAWLKKDKLPGAISMIAQTESAANAHRYDDALNKMFTSEIDAIRRDLISRYDAPILDLLASLSDEQVDYLKKKFEKSNKDLVDVLKDRDPVQEYKDVMLKKQIKNLNEWYGDLTKPQADAFHNAMTLARPQIESRLGERRRIQDYMLSTLRSHDRNRIKAMVNSFRDKGEVWQDATYLQYRDAAEKRWELYLMDFHKSLSNEQWTHLEKRLREMRGELEQMIAVK